MRTSELKQDAIRFSVKTEFSNLMSTIAFAVIASRNRDSNRLCTHRKCKGHNASECFLLHDYLKKFLEQQQQHRSAPGKSQRGRGGCNSTTGDRG